jgi:hypothetical protein
MLSSVAPLHAKQVCDTSAYPLSSPNERFEDHLDGTVTDRSSKLMWMRCAAGQNWAGDSCSGRPSTHDWQAAQAFAGDVNQRGSYFYKDWRVPKVRELATIVERECKDPRVNLTMFPSTPAGFFWTASVRQGEGFASSAYALSFGDDGVGQLPKAMENYVRLVRDAR